MMWLRRTPVRVVADALDSAESLGLDVSAETLEGYLLAGGDPKRIVEAARLAKQHEIEVSFETLAAVDLFGRDPVEELQASMIPKVHAFSTYADDMTEPISGVTQDGTRVMARCTLGYREPFNFVALPWKPTDVQERLSARIFVFINTASSYIELGMKRPEHEANLLVLAQRLLRSAHNVELQYQRELPRA